MVRARARVRVRVRARVGVRARARARGRVRVRVRVRVRACRMGSSDLMRCIVVPGVFSGLESMYFHDVCSGVG